MKAMLLLSSNRHVSSLPFLVSRYSLRRICRRSISLSRLTIEHQTNTTHFDQRPPNQDLVFGTTFSDHMLMVEWNQESQWSDPRIIPYQDLKLSPASSCLHYGKGCGLVASWPRAMIAHDVFDTIFLVGSSLSLTHAHLCN